MLRERVHVVLRDSAANMEKSTREGGLPTLPCMAHACQLAVHDGLLAQRMISDIDNLIDEKQTNKSLIGKKC